MEPMELIESYAPWLGHSLYGIEVWIWVALPLFLLSSWVLAKLLVRGAGAIARGLSRRIKDVYEAYIKPFFSPLEIFITALLFAFLAKLLPLTDAAETYVSLFEVLLFTVAGLWAALRITDVAVTRSKAYLTEKGNPGAVAVMPLLSKILKIFIFIVAGLFLLQNFGFDVAAIIAALGIGGIAVALAGQKSVENLLGGIMLSLDQPVRVGDFCKFGDNIGTVEDIGLRSTRIRTLGRTLLTIPNSEFSSMQLENFAHRDKILLHTNIGLRYETTPDQMRYIIVELRKLLIGHPKVESTPGRARFVAFNDYSLDIEIFAYILTSDWAEFLEVREDIFLRIMNIVEESGSGFAFPSQTVYFERGGGLDDKARKTAEKQIVQARKENRNYFPDIPENEKAEIENKIPYPEV